MTEIGLQIGLSTSSHSQKRKNWILFIIYYLIFWMLSFTNKKTKRAYVFNLPNTIAPWKMDRERIVVHQLDDIEVGTVAQCFEVVQISDNCSSRRCNHASYALSRAVAETIEPENEQKSKQNTHHRINYLYIIFNEFYSKEKFKWKCLNILLVVFCKRVLGQVPRKICI